MSLWKRIKADSFVVVPAVLMLFGSEEKAVSVYLVWLFQLHFSYIIYGLHAERSLPAGVINKHEGKQPVRMRLIF